MKKIMFNDRYGLTDAVLTGRKTQTRRIATNAVLSTPSPSFETAQKAYESLVIDKALYKVGEVVAVAQSYSHIARYVNLRNRVSYQDAGWNNKMYVRADLMLHHIRITNIRVERLQDISDEDCLKEGVGVLNGEFYFVNRRKIKHLLAEGGVLKGNWYFIKGIKIKHLTIRHKNIDGKWQTFKWQVYETLRYAYAALINKVCGKGTWESNPWVFVYDFELVL